MLHLFRVGDKVKVWPRPGHDVPSAPPQTIETPAGPQTLLARPLKPEGQVVEWSAWLQEMARHGGVFMTDPRSEEDGGPKGSEGIVAAVHVRHPHECGPDGKPAVAGGAASEAELAHWQALFPDHDHEDEKKCCECGHDFKLKPAEKKAEKVEG